MTSRTSCSRRANSSKSAVPPNNRVHRAASRNRVAEHSAPFLPTPGPTPTVRLPVLRGVATGDRSSYRCTGLPLRAVPPRLVCAATLAATAQAPRACRCPRQAGGRVRCRGGAETELKSYTRATDTQRGSRGGRRCPRASLSARPGHRSCCLKGVVPFGGGVLFCGHAAVTLARDWSRYFRPAYSGDPGLVTRSSNGESSRRPTKRIRVPSPRTRFPHAGRT